MFERAAHLAEITTVRAIHPEGHQLFNSEWPDMPDIWMAGRGMEPIGKMAGAEHNIRVQEFCMDIMGADGMLYGGYARAGEGSGSLEDTTRVAFLRSRANTIEGGTAEIMRNILGERVLGLPGDVRVDRDRPWKDVPRS